MRSSHIKRKALSLHICDWIISLKGTQIFVIILLLVGSPLFNSPMVRKKATSQSERSMLLFRGCFAKKRGQFEGRFEVFRNLYLRDLISSLRDL